MYSENNALMHLCALALKTLYLLNSIYPLSHLIKYLQGVNENEFPKQSVKVLRQIQYFLFTCINLDFFFNRKTLMN